VLARASARSAATSWPLQGAPLLRVDLLMGDYTILWLDAGATPIYGAYLARHPP
jgi:hypothetical protein